MGWFDTLINVVDVSTNLSNYQRLSQIVNQKATEDEKNDFIHSMKNHVFNIGEAAKNCFEFEQPNPFIAAVGLNYLKSRITELSLTPDIFPEHVDKTYLVNITNLIKENLNRIISNFSETTKFTVLSRTDLIDNFDSIKYYIDNYDSFIKYKNMNSRAISDYEKTHHFDRLVEIDKIYNGNIKSASEDFDNANSLLKEFSLNIPEIINISNQTNYSLINIVSHCKFNTITSVDDCIFARVKGRKNVLSPISPGEHKICIEIDKSGYLLSGSSFCEPIAINCLKKFSHVIECNYKDRFTRFEIILKQIK